MSTEPYTKEQLEAWEAMRPTDDSADYRVVLLSRQCLSLMAERDEAREENRVARDAYHEKEMELSTLRTKLAEFLPPERICLVCGADKPCMTQAEADAKDPNNPGIPCTFDPTPKEWSAAVKSLRAELEKTEAEAAAMKDAIEYSFVITRGSIAGGKLEASINGYAGTALSLRVGRAAEGGGGGRGGCSRSRNTPNGDRL